MKAVQLFGVEDLRVTDDVKNFRTLAFGGPFTPSEGYHLDRIMKEIQHVFFGGKHDTNGAWR